MLKIKNKAQGNSRLVHKAQGNSRLVHKAQGSLEFLILLGVVLFIFTIFLIAIGGSMHDKTKEKINKRVNNVALIVQDEIQLASSSSNGYFRNFSLPEDISGLDYEINITGNLVYIRTTDGRYATSLNVMNVTGDVVKGGNTIKKENDIVYLNP
jgi:uncharacterized protein (UPF0333 family)